MNSNSYPDDWQYVPSLYGKGCPDDWHWLPCHWQWSTNYYNCMPLVAQMLVMVAHMAMNAKMNGKELPH